MNPSLQVIFKNIFSNDVCKNIFSTDICKNMFSTGVWQANTHFVM